MPKGISDILDPDCDSRNHFLHIRSTPKWRSEEKIFFFDFLYQVNVIPVVKNVSVAKNVDSLCRARDCFFSLESVLQIYNSTIPPCIG